MSLFNIRQNLREITGAIASHRRDEYFLAHFAIGRPAFGITWTLSNHPWFNEGKLTSEFTLGKWPD